MRTAFFDAVRGEHQYFGSVSDRRQAVRNRKSRSPLRQAFQRVLYEFLAFIVQRRGCLIQNQNGGFFRNILYTG